MIRNEHWIVFVPEAARWPYEVRIFPATRVPDLTDVGEAARDAFGPLYLDVLRRFDALFGQPAPYIAAWHQAPVADEIARRQFAAHLQVLSVRRTGRQAEVPRRNRIRHGRVDQRHRARRGGATAQGGLMRVLVTGGAGYIGSVVGAQLVAAGHEVTVLDDLSTGFADAVPPGVAFVKGTLRDCAAEVLSDGIDGVLHFAAKSLVGESVADPAKYWSNNLGGTVALLEAMREMRIRTIVFSSTAAVYGEPERALVVETDPTRPTSPYGASKLAVDTTLTEPLAVRVRRGEPALLQHGRRAARCADGGWFGERHNPETHLIPNVLAAAAEGRPVQIFGDDYPTPDGTCVRDYIHVSDLADAHLRALAACRPGQHRVYNLGNGAGFSVREVVEVCREVTDADIGTDVGTPRPGDPAVLVASSAKIRSELGWRAEKDLRAMAADAWRFTQARSLAGERAKGRRRRLD